MFKKKVFGDEVELLIHSVPTLCLLESGVKIQQPIYQLTETNVNKMKERSDTTP